MKAAIIEKFGNISIRDIPDPQPGEYDVLCEILYGATCTGTDSHIIDGTFPFIGALPTVLGHESVGRVVSTGRKVRNFKAGDLVTRVGTPPSPDGRISVTWGGFARLGIAKDHWAMSEDGLPSKEWERFQVNQVVPAGISPEVAPMFTPWRETLSYVTRLGVARGVSVLVFGSGGNGLAIAVNCMNLGASPVGMVGSEKQADRLKSRTKLGFYADYKSPLLEKTINDALPGGFDFVIDAVGKTEICEIAPRFVKPGGKFSVYGMDDFGKLSISLRQVRRPLLICPCSYNEAEAHRQVSEWALQGKLDATLWYDPSNPYPLSAIGQAYRDLRERKIMKALIRLKD